MRKIWMILLVGLIVIMLLPINSNAASYSDADGDGFYEPNEPITFHGEYSYIDNYGIEREWGPWYWDFNYDDVYESSGREQTKTFADEGTYSVALWEINGDARALELIIEITRGFQINDADGDGFCEPYEPITFVGEATYYGPSGSVRNYREWYWDFDNDGSPDSSQRITTTTFDTSGIYPVTLMAMYIEGDGHTITMDVEVKNSFSVSDADGDGVCEPGELITFTGDTTYYDKFGLEHEYATWNWDIDCDGSPDYSGKSITHTFQDDGINEVTLTESNGEVTKITEKIEIQYNIIIYQFKDLEPSNAPITQDGNTFTLTDDIYGRIYLDGIYPRSIILDGAGYNLYGLGSGTGIYAVSQYDILIKNFNIYGFEYGIYFAYCIEGTIDNNYIHDNEIGICFGRTTPNFVFKENTIMNNNYGILFKKLSVGNSRFYHNNIINNDILIDVGASTIRWDNGAGEGNYWSDYDGLDDGSNGRTAGDGIGDTDLPHNGLDNYPLMEPDITKIFPGGDGTEGNPYQISNVYELQNMNLDLSAHYIIINDIDASETSTWNDGVGFEPVGTETNPFTGSLDGDGYKITDLYINRPTEDYIGLFGLTFNCEIKNVGLENIEVNGGNSCVGGLVGQNSKSTILNSYVTGSVSNTGTNSNYIAGLVGFSLSYSMISDSYSTASVTSTTTGTFARCYAVAGLVGDNSRTTISNCYATGSVSSTVTATGGTDPRAESHYVGGLVGNHQRSTISNCYATGSVSSTAIATGGTNPYAQSQIVGGFIAGHNDGGTVSNCYATGSVSSTATASGGTNSQAESRWVGGLVGMIGDDGTISNCYATGSVSSTATAIDSNSYNIGGLVGKNFDCTISNSYWDTETSSQATSDGGTGKTTSEMKNIATFTDTSTSGLTTAWDFVNDPNDDTGLEDIWDIYSLINDGYPFLGWQPNTPTGDNIEVHLGSGVTVTFDKVTTEGDTTLTFVPGQPPADFRLWPTGYYFEIETTAEYTGDITLEIYYGDYGLAFWQELFLRLHHWDEIAETWDDITTSNNMINDIIYGTVSSLSPFALMTPLSILAEIDIDPNTLNLKSKGKWITCYIELPEGFDVEDIDVNSIRLDDQDDLKVKKSNIQENVLMVKFDRQDIIDYLKEMSVENNQEVELTVTGEMADDIPFEGSDTIHVKNKGK